MSGKRSKRVRRVVRRHFGEQYFELYNTLCSQPLKHRIRTACRILFGGKLKAK